MRIEKQAFTLAEVLITLGIIGIVAALTLPALIAKHQKSAAVSQLQKTYSTVQNMIKRAELENGPAGEWSEWDSTVPHYLKDVNAVVSKKLKPMSSGAKIFEGTPEDTAYNKGMCYQHGQTKLQIDKSGNETQYVWLNRALITSPVTYRLASMQLADGSCVGFQPINHDYFITDIYIDINGPNKGPNMAGKDFFMFRLGKDGKMLPYGYDLPSNELTKPLQSYCTSHPNLNGGIYCAAKIFNDGWRIKNDYPW